MLYYTVARAQAKRAISTPSCGWGQAEAAAAKGLSTPPPPTAIGMDKLYLQMAEIHTITTAQLAECVRWHRSDSTPSVTPHVSNPHD
jgi:hypothetical protein